MPWVKLDDQFFSNPKVLKAGRDARDLYLVGLTYCARSLTDGEIPREALRILGAMAEIDDARGSAARLVECGLWEETETGWAVHDYLEYNPSKETVMQTREARAEAGARGGLKRAENAAQAKAKQIACGVASDMLKQNPTPSTSTSTSTDPSKDQELAAATPAAPAQPAAPDGKADAPKPRARSGADALRLALETHFSEYTGIKRPMPDTEKRKREAGSQWWGPLREIAALGNNDERRAKRIIERAVDKLRADELTICDPNSILKTARAVAGEDATGTSKQAQIVAEHERRVMEDRARFGIATGAGR